MKKVTNCTDRENLNEFMLKLSNNPEVSRFVAGNIANIGLSHSNCNECTITMKINVTPKGEI